MTKYVDSAPVKTTACLAEILFRVINGFMPNVFNEEEQVALVTESIGGGSTKKEVTP